MIKISAIMIIKTGDTIHSEFYCGDLIRLRNKLDSLSLHDEILSLKIKEPTHSPPPVTPLCNAECEECKLLAG